MSLARICLLRRIWLICMRKAERGARFGSARLPLDKMLERNVMTQNSGLAGYVRNKDLSTTLRVFSKMLGRNVDSWTTMVSGGAQGMQRANRGLDQVALPVTISACAGVDDLRLGRSIVQFLKAHTGLINLGPLRYCNGAPIIRASGLVDIKSAADITDPTLPSTPKKPTLYYPSATRLIAVSAW
ncbi:hypothetical protein U1Q18_003703, partial [Sarracenia purpurea var. burkii]